VFEPLAGSWQMLLRFFPFPAAYLEVEPVVAGALAQWLDLKLARPPALEAGLWAPAPPQLVLGLWHMCYECCT
jgi:hypothetical protein